MEHPEDWLLLFPSIGLIERGCNLHEFITRYRHIRNPYAEAAELVKLFPSSVDPASVKKFRTTSTSK